MELTHKPSRYQALLFFLFTLALGLGILAWTFFINIGSLVIEGEPPFKVKIGLEDKTCDSSLCRFTLKPRSYTVHISKEGFRTYEKNANVIRRKETKILANLEFIPVLREVGELKIPFDDLPLRAPFLGQENLPNFPKNVKSVAASPKGDILLLTIGKEIYLYDVKEKSVLETTISPDMKPAWLGNDIIFLVHDEGKDVLKHWNKGKISPMTTFVRPFKTPLLAGSPDGLFVLIEDDGAFYLINVQKKSRSRLEIGKDFQFDHFTPHFMIFTSKDGEQQKTIVIEIDTLEKHLTGGIDANNVEEIAPNRLLMVTAQKLDGADSNVGVTITEAIQQAKKETAEGVKRTTTVYIAELNIDENIYSTLVEVSLQRGQRIRRLTFDSAAGKIYFEKNDKLFEILLRKI